MYNDKSGFANMKKDHWEKDPGKVSVSDLKYTDRPNPEALKDSVDKLSGYVKSHKMKY